MNKKCTDRSPGILAVFAANIYEGLVAVAAVNDHGTDDHEITGGRDQFQGTGIRSVYSLIGCPGDFTPDIEL